MSDIDDDGLTTDSGEEALLGALRRLRADRMPEHDLWPAIAASIAGDARPTRTPWPGRRSRRVVPWAIAASCLLALGAAWQWQPSRPADARAQLITHEAQAMTREYQGALQVIARSAPASVEGDPALHELDDSAAQIRRALQQDPDARFLLDRLRRTYAMRLELTQRAALT
ncbi:hypothetical protein [Cognatiluteimonas telluris]|jgi:hypothetical protein|uniref:hypothetical protein n=1 Tax=Cognatiluteimonas telluris TaxID=1104775 RepID=UPI00140A3E2B|nr:hypothetical protein [Lysobacter telluris]